MIRWCWLLLPWFVAADWPQWRGPTADGVSSENAFPLRWSATENVLWKVELPGHGNSSPVVMGDDVILTASSGRDDSELHILCYDRRTGRPRWQRDLFAGPADPPFRMFPPERGHAAPTPVVTADQIVALFGSGDLVCLDREGRPLWLRSLSRDFGLIRNDYGLAASPIVVDGLVLVQIDHLEGSYLLAVDRRTGQTRWKTPRPHAYDNWATPVVAEVGGQRQVIALGTQRISGYDVASGTERWSLPGLERLCSCTPIVRGDRLYAVSGPAGATLAIDLAAMPAPNVLWTSKKNGPFVPSGIVVGDYHIACDDRGLATCLDHATGTELWRERLGNARMRGSPVAAGHRVYLTDLEGTTIIFKAAARFEIVAKNRLGEPVAASPALSSGMIFLRGERHLWCVGENEP
jgi:outer membrane protein assembly factor BamB